MKKTAVCFLVHCALASHAGAQTGAVTIDDLTAPTSPGFVLLDLAPASVERPENPKSFALNLLNRLASSSGLPKDYAMEVAPYWLHSHPGLTFREYQRPTVLQSMAQTFSVSVATTPAGDAPSASPGTRLALGLRANVWNGRPSSSLEDLVENLEQINGVILDKLARKENIDEERAEARETSLAIQALDKQRLGFFLTVAGGQVWEIPDADTRHSRVQRRGFWVTPAYRVRACGPAGAACVSSVDFIGVVRALKDLQKDALWDYGARLLWRPTKELHLSVETLQRNKRSATPAPADTSRTVGMLEYRIRPDLVVYGSFGRDFEKDSGVRPLVSIMGLNIGFGPTPSVTPVTTKPKRK